MNRNGCIKTLIGAMVPILMAIILLALSNISIIWTFALIIVLVMCVFAVLFGLIDFAKEIDLAVLSGKQANIGKLFTADDIRKAYNADWINFTVEQIGIVTDKDKHPCTTLAKIYIYHAFSANGKLIDIDDKKTRTIATPQQLEEDKHYIVNNQGCIKQVEKLV